jgi:predicted RNA-binding Zn-ribbon protein involved in translation (DUF1610 family)
VKKVAKIQMNREPKHAQGHSLNVSKTSTGEFACPECGKPFRDKEIAETHLHKEHIEHLKTYHSEYHGKDDDHRHHGKK